MIFVYLCYSFKDKELFKVTESDDLTVSKYEVSLVCIFH